MMESSDEAVERVLAGLRHVEAPAGIEQRILEMARNGALERRRWSVAMPWRLGGMESWAIAVAGVVVVSSVVCWTALREHRSGTAKMVSKHQVISASPVKALVQAVEVSALPDRPTLRVHESANAGRVRYVRETKSAPMHDVGADNHPAPEAPLTEQEKLLLRLAHRTSPVEVAVLNPSLWAMRDAAEKAEVQKFFEPPKTGDDK